MKRIKILSLLAVAILFSVSAFPQVSSGVVKPFSSRLFTFSTKGDFTMIGNSNMTGQGNASGSFNNSNNDGKNMVYVDVDNDGSTLNSSSATLGFQSENNMDPNNTQIVYAGLYWSGRAFSTGMRSGEPTPSINFTFNGHSFDKRQVKLKGPGASGYTTINAHYLATNGSNNSSTDIYFPLGSPSAGSNAYNIYVGYADVTDYVKQYGVGEYTVADIALRTGNANGIGYFGGWMMVVVYSNNAMRSRNISLFDGYAFVDNNTTANYDIPVTGFLAQPTGHVKAKFGYFAGEGDLGTSGDFLRILKSGKSGSSNADWVTLDHGSGTSNNFFNSQIVGVPNRNPVNANNYGIDLGIIELDNTNNSIINNNDESTKFRYGTNGETYVITFLGFSIETLQFRGKVVNDANGNNDDIVNGLGTNISGALYANVLDKTTGQVISVVPVDASGNFDLKGIYDNYGPGDYIVQISKDQGVLGQPLPSGNLPAGWVFVGNTNSGGIPTGTQFLGRQDFTISGNGDVTGLIIGVNMTPVATKKIFVGVPTEEFTDNWTLPNTHLGIPLNSTALPGYDGTNGSLSGHDFEDCPMPNTCHTGTYTTYKIKSILPNTKLYYNFGSGHEEIDLTGGDVTISAYEFERMILFGEQDPHNVQTYGFEYTIVDAAGAESPTVQYLITPDKILAINLADFGAEKQGETVRLWWTTSSESNNTGFDVERSADGQNFNVIGHVNSKAFNGNSNANLNYQFVDNDLQDGINYYRLNQLDFDGRSSLSEVKTVTFKSSGSVTLFPNPVSNSAVLKGLKGTETLRMYDASGRMLWNERANGSQSTLNFTNLPQGTYRIQVISNDGKLIKTISAIKAR